MTNETTISRDPKTCGQEGCCNPVADGLVLCPDCLKKLGSGINADGTHKSPPVLETPAVEVITKLDAMVGAAHTLRLVLLMTNDPIPVKIGNAMDDLELLLETYWGLRPKLIARCMKYYKPTE